MKRFARRFAVAALVAAPVLSVPAMSEAGVIPWLYDAIFGPVYPGYGGNGYGGYPMAAPYGGTGACSPCGAPCLSAAPSPCSTGACPTTVAFYSPCGSACDAPRTVYSSAAPKKAEPATSGVDQPAPKSTFKQTAPSDLDDISPHDASRPATPVPATKPAPASVGDIGAGLSGGEQTVEGSGVSKEPGAADPGDNLDFSAPKPGTVPEPAPSGTGTPTLDPATELELKQGSQLDLRSTWKVTVQLPRRSALPQPVGTVSLVRRSVPVNAEYVIPAESSARVASR